MLGENKQNKNNSNPCTRKKKQTENQQRNKKSMWWVWRWGTFTRVARGGRGDEEDEEGGSCGAQWVRTTGQFLSIIPPFRGVFVWRCGKGGKFHSIVTDCPVSVCSPGRGQRSVCGARVATEFGQAGLRTACCSSYSDASRRWLFFNTAWRIKFVTTATVRGKQAWLPVKL